MRSVTRALVGMVLSSAVAGVLAPRAIPDPDPLLGPAVQAPTFTIFTLRLVAAGRCGHLGRAQRATPNGRRLARDAVDDALDDGDRAAR